MTRIVHAQTTIQTIFGLLDEDGNLIPQQPITINLNIFDPQAFVEAHTMIVQARDKAMAAYEAEQADDHQAEADDHHAEHASPASCSKATS